MDEADVDWIFLGGVMAFAKVTWFEEGIDWSDDELLSFHFFSNHFVQKFSVCYHNFRALS